MSGTGTGRGSGRAHFRSKSGCCICGTKSSSSRFTASERYAEHFGNCFGDGAANRSGDLCNACVLCVKRWLSRGKEIGRFKQSETIQQLTYGFTAFFNLRYQDHARGQLKSSLNYAKCVNMI
ncbi:hypothetical protein ACTXT7_013228 [Hymenolepis weldensis]